MIKLFREFLQDTSGATTVEWVVIAAAVVGLAIAALSVVAPGINNIANANQNCINESNGQGCLANYLD